MSQYEQTDFNLLQDAPVSLDRDQDHGWGEPERTDAYRLIQCYSRGIDYHHSRVPGDDGQDALQDTLGAAVEDRLHGVFRDMGLDTAAPVLAQRYRDRVMDHVELVPHQAEDRAGQAGEQGQRYDLRLAMR